MIDRLFETVHKDPGLALIVLVLVFLAFFMCVGSFKFN